jgi:hypothetical protein
MIRVELSPDLKRIVAAGVPGELIDVTSGETFYLISADEHHRIADQIADGVDVREQYPFVDRTMFNDDLHDPLLESYQ